MTSAYLASWLLLVTVFSAALVSPGPDFVMSVRNSLLFGRRAGIMTALGFALGVIVHMGYTLLGIGVLIMNSVLAFNVIKYLGAGYLMWLGYKALRSQGMDKGSTEASLNNTALAHKSDWVALRDGFMTNLLNPKATLFFVALISQIITPTMPIEVRVLFGLTCCAMTVGWFSLVAMIMTQAPIRRRYVAASKWIDRTLGVFLLGFGLRLAFSRAHT